MSDAIGPAEHPDVHPASLTSPVWRPGRAMSANDPRRRAWVDPALQFETAVDRSAAHKTYVNVYEAVSGPTGNLTHSVRHGGAAS